MEGTHRIRMYKAYRLALNTKTLYKSQQAPGENNVGQGKQGSPGRKTDKISLIGNFLHPGSSREDAVPCGRWRQSEKGKTLGVEAMSPKLDEIEEKGGVNIWGNVTEILGEGCGQMVGAGQPFE